MLKDVLINVLEKIVQDLKSGKYDCSDDQIASVIAEILELQTELAMSKELACKFLHLSRSTFDTYVRNGYIPRGKKALGFKELSWSKADLQIAKEKLNSILSV